MQFYFIPEWAKFIVMDHNETWYAHEKEPIYDKSAHAWVSRGLRERVFVKADTTLKEIGEKQDETI